MGRLIDDWQAIRRIVERFGWREDGTSAISGKWGGRTRRYHVSVRVAACLGVSHITPLSSLAYHAAEPVGHLCSNFGVLVSVNPFCMGWIGVKVATSPGT